MVRLGAGSFIFGLAIFVISMTDAMPQERILGGAMAGLNDFKYMVAFVRNKKLVFGGTVVGSNAVLTAGHNLDGIADGFEDKADYNVIIGTNDLTKATSDQTYQIQKYVRPSGYKAQDPSNDIGLVFLTKAVASGVPKVNIRGFVENSLAKDCTIIGWGYTEDTGTSTSSLLKLAQVNIIPDTSICDKLLKPTGSFSEPAYKRICIKGVNGNQCEGDSGGPLMCTYDGHRLQLGIISETVSSGNRCGFKNGYSEACNVSEQQDWILTQVATQGK